MARIDDINIPWPLSTDPGPVDKPMESTGRLINCSAEPRGDKPIWKRQPGLTQFADTTVTGYRGGLLVGSLFYAAVNGKLVAINSSGTVTNVGAGTLTGSLPVTMARNNLTPTPQVAIVTENGAFLTDSTGSVTPAAWPDPDLPFPNSVCFQDGFFFFGIADRRVFATAVNSSSVDPATFIIAEAKSSDSLVRVLPHKGLLFVFCTASCEIWQDTSNPTPGFPYTRLAVLDRGLASLTSVAGWHDGFGTMLWVSDDNGVWKLNDALQPEKVSPPELDRLITAVTDKTTLSAGCYVYAGKRFWHLSSPSWTWEFNLNTEKWNERQSFTGTGNSTLTRWRGMHGNYAFGKWLLGDAQSGKIGAIDPTAYTEFSNSLLFRMESGLVENFPLRARIARADFEFMAGVGVATGTDPIQTDPTVQISWSQDGGMTWGNPVFRKLGRQADANRRIYVLNTGQSGPRGRRWRLDITDPVYVGFEGGAQSADARTV